MKLLKNILVLKMPYKKKFRKSRKSHRGRPSRRYHPKYIRPALASRSLVGPYYKPYMFKRSCNLSFSGNAAIFTAVGTQTGSPNVGQTITSFGDAIVLTSGTTTSNFTYYNLNLSFTLNQLPDPTDFTTLFDRYMIMGVSVKLIPLATQSNTESVVVASNGIEATGCWVYSVIDYDDINAVAPCNDVGVNLMREYAGFKAKNFFDARKPGLKRYIRPRTALAQIDTSGAVVATANQKHVWVDMSNTAIRHYGIKIMFEMFQPVLGTSQQLWFKPSLTYYFKCKDLR